MKKLYLFAAALCAALTLNAEKTLVIDTLFIDNFDALSENYTIHTADSKLVTVSNNALSLACPKNSTNAQNIVVGDYDRQDVNLNALEVDSVVWTISMREGYGKPTDALSGFNSGKRGIATILLADGEDMTKANGYAIAFGGNSKIQYRLVKFAGGFTASANLTDVIAGVDNTANGIAKNYYTFRVVYVPATQTWSLYEANDGSAFVAPDNVTTWTADGSAVDDTYGATPVQYFGYLQNYAGSQDFKTLFANMKCATYLTSETPQPTSLVNTKTAARCTKVMRNNKIMIEREGVSYTILGTEIK